MESRARPWRGTQAPGAGLSNSTPRSGRTLSLKPCNLTVMATASSQRLAEAASWIHTSLTLITKFGLFAGIIGAFMQARGLGEEWSGMKCSGCKVARFCR